MLSTRNTASLTRCFTLSSARNCSAGLDPDVSKGVLHAFLFELLDLLLVLINYGQMRLNNRPISVTERKFHEEISSSQAEQLAVEGVVSAFEECSDAVFSAIRSSTRDFLVRTGSANCVISFDET